MTQDGRHEDGTFKPSDRPRVRIERVDADYFLLHRPDETQIGGGRAILERLARREGWIPVVDAPKPKRRGTFVNLANGGTFDW